jgi:hypothetical protein
MSSRLDAGNAVKIAKFLLPAYRLQPAKPLLICLYSDVEAPRFTQAMLRDPMPPVGAILNETFADHYKAALKVNSEIHDGAALAQFDPRNKAYAVTEWSHRLFPPSNQSDIPNRGSAFHSSLAMSQLEEIDAVYLLSRDVCTIFVGGKILHAANV